MFTKSGFVKEQFVELDQVLHTIKNDINPEVHHFRHGSHPGCDWYIKTILPNHAHLDETAQFIFDSWDDLQRKNPKLVNIGSIAYDWHGMPIDGYGTIWLNSKIDVIYKMTNHGNIGFEFQDYDSGLKISALAIERYLLANDSRQIENRSYHELASVANFLKTYTCDAHSRTKRTKLRIIDDACTHSSTTNRDELDPNIKR